MEWLYNPYPVSYAFGDNLAFRMVDGIPGQKTVALHPVRLGVDAPETPPEATWGASIRLPIMADATIADGIIPTNDHGGGNQLRVYRDSAWEYRCLVKADVSGIPRGSTVASARLVFRQSSGVSGISSVRRVLREWGEGSEWAGQASYGNANWIYAKHDTDPWEVPGADGLGDAVASGTLRTVAQGSAFNNASVPLAIRSSELAADVQGFVDRQFPNYGWLIAPPPVVTAAWTGLYSREVEADALKPYLEVIFTPPPGGGGGAAPVIGSTIVRSMP